jgi:MYXO-CTERM domain-containing protein
MDWIERIFHVSPDGGDGTLEAVYYAVAALGVVAFAFRRRLGRWARSRRRREP